MHEHAVQTAVECSRLEAFNSSVTCYQYNQTAQQDIVVVEPKAGDLMNGNESQSLHSIGI